VLSISKNSEILFSVGVLSSAVQCIFLREYLAVFSGNEFIVGIILALWLCPTGLGSLFGSRVRNAENLTNALDHYTFSQINIYRTLALLVVLSVIGLFSIRASRLVVSSGQMIGPLQVLAVLVVSEAPFGFINGYLFGALSGKALQTVNPYGFESFGALSGALLTYACIMLNAENAIIVGLASAPCLFILRKIPAMMIALLAIMSAMFFMNTGSMHWKYHFPFSSVSYGQEGEIVSVEKTNDTTYMLNGTLYKSIAQKQFLEQAVHLPLATRAFPKNVLVVFDRGHSRELKKYPGVSVDCIESEPRLASPGSNIVSPESFKSNKRYDAIFLGSGMPQTAATGRLYSISFFKKMKTLMTDSGIFSFSLPFSENYLSATEKRMKDVLKSTLNKAFSNVLIFPGDGYTFLASDKAMTFPARPHVKTDYLETSIMPSVSAERIASANEKPSVTFINRADKPIGLLFGLMLWTDLFEKQCWGIILFLVILFVALFIALPKSKEALSLGSTGFVVGTYSIALLLLYQSIYGLLYSRVSLFFCFLTCGFICGTLVKKLPYSDVVIGVFCFASLGLLSGISYPPAILFYCAHLCIGILAGAQFVSMKKTAPGTLYAADCVGGAFGMAFSTAGIALFGITNVAAGLCAVKAIVWVIGMMRR
jgi:spermidine synthase